MAFNDKFDDLKNSLWSAVQGDGAEKKPSNPILSVIKNSSRNGEICYKVPAEDFNNGAQLIVAEYEEALFMKDGIIEEVFTPGKYTLTTENYPFLTRLLTRALTGGNSPFNCRVYFINKAHHLELKWGTMDPIEVMDPIHGVNVRLSARGSYSVCVGNSKQFFLKLVGSHGSSLAPSAAANMRALRPGDVNEESIKNSFKTAFRQNITDELAAYLTGGDEDLLTMLNRKKALADSLRAPLNDVLDEYGLELVNFYIENIQAPEGDPGMDYIRGKRIERQERMFEREQKLADKRLDFGLDREAADKDRYVKGQSSQADYERMKIMDQDGNNGWARMEAAKIMNTAAANEGDGGMFMRAGMGVGMGASIGKAAGNMVNSLFDQNMAGAAAAPGSICPQCGASVPNGMKFCGVCGTSVEPPKTVCANCGAEIPGGMRFCGICGTPVGPVKKFCSKCGAEIPEGMRFCGICGNREDM